MDTRTITAEDIMTRRLAVTSPQTHVIEAIERLIAHGVSGLPVVRSSGEFAGRFSERSAIAALDLNAVSSSARATTAQSDISATDLMDRSGLVLQSDQDVFQSAKQLIASKASGAPVVDADGTLLGVFSEQSVMHAFIGLCWEQLPTSSVTAWLDRHEDRRIFENTRLEEILVRFQTTSHRRLMVLHGDRLVGQVTRRDALQASLATSREPIAASRDVAGEQQLGLKTCVEAWMDREPEVVSADSDVLTIANQFLRTSARQLSVVDGSRLDGQISRSDLLRAVQRFFPEQAASHGAQPLYLTSLNKHDAQAVI